MNTKIFAIVNQKGGVGKTTTIVNLATAFAAINKRVLIIDFDPQGNASTAFGIMQNDRIVNIYDVIISQCHISESILRTKIPNLDIITSTVDLSAIEIEISNSGNQDYQFILREKLKDIVDEYDYIFIDCPPSLGLLTVNALTTANSVMIPLQCEFFALEGLSHLFKTIMLVKDNLNRTLKIDGIVLTMYDKRNRLNEQVEADVREYFGGKVYKSVIPRNVKLSEAPSHGKPAIIYDLQCIGSVAYINLAREIIARHEKIVSCETSEFETENAA